MWRHILKYSSLPKKKLPIRLGSNERVATFKRAAAVIEVKTEGGIGADPARNNMVRDMKYKEAVDTLGLAIEVLKKRIKTMQTRPSLWTIARRMTSFKIRNIAKVK